MDILSKFAERLKELMNEKDLNAPLFADRIGVNSNSITQYLRGLHAPTYRVFLKMLEYFDCSADFLLGLSEFPRRENQVFRSAGEFSKRFRQAIKDCKTSQYALQKKTGITWANFHSWLNGKSLPYLDSLVKISEGLECSVDFLLGRED